jgi:hypothetical protein
MIPHAHADTTTTLYRCTVHNCARCRWCKQYRIAVALAVPPAVPVHTTNAPNGPPPIVTPTTLASHAEYVLSSGSPLYAVLLLRVRCVLLLVAVLMGLLWLSKALASSEGRR